MSSPHSYAGAAEMPWELQFLERQANALRSVDPVRAGLVFEELLTRWPDHRPALKAYGRLLVREREREEARAIWKQLSQLAPEDREPSRQLARIDASPHEPDGVSDYDRQLFAIHAAARLGRWPALLDGLEQLAAYGDFPEVVDAIRLHGPTLVAALGRDGPGSSADRDIVERRLARLFRRTPGLLALLLRRAIEHHGGEGAEVLLREAAEDGVSDDVGTLVETILLRDAPDGETIITAALLLAAFGRYERALSYWERALTTQPTLTIQRRFLRMLHVAGRPAEFLHAAFLFFQHAEAIERRPAKEQNFAVALTRQICRAAQRAKALDRLGEIEQAVRRHNAPSRLRLWIEASFAAARIAQSEALALLDTALLLPPLTMGVELDIHAERALLFMRYHRYGEAAEAFSLASPVVVERCYRKPYEKLCDVAAVCPAASQPLRYPECLIDVIFDETAAAPLRYEPQARHVCMVTGTLGPGGGERQTETMLRRLRHDPRITALSLLIRSVHLKPNDDFFYGSVQAMGVDHAVYGLDWQTPSDIAALLPELAERSRLRRAIALLPHTAREDVARLCRELWNRRPQAVHIRQDLYAAALACVITGVPRFFIHRGSLSPDHWEHNTLQTETNIRAMRHCYRRLLERPNFLLVNNSTAGSHTDQAWTEWSDPTRFRVVYNAVDFARLGEDQGRNLGLRRSLGIPDDAPLIGGAFRMQPVKRPLFWAEAARLIREAVPEAHFLIIGDGPMAEDVAAYARDHGFGDRMHLPGRVSDVGAWYRAMDLKLLTSEREGTPNAIIEAQHFGVPVVATQVGGIPEAMQSGMTGAVVPGQSPAEYAQAAVRILRDPAWHAAARRCARDYVHRTFSLDCVVDQLIDLYGIAEARRS